MASTLDLPSKSTRRMTESEVRAEAVRFGVAHDDDLETLRAALKRELDRRWQEDNRKAAEGWNRWIEKNGLPLEKYRCW
ncbi:type II toxin-antitoxin system CcdA family antitoxin [Sphingomonas sp. M6A6_1c]